MYTTTFIRYAIKNSYSNYFPNPVKPLNFQNKTVF